MSVRASAAPRQTLCEVKLLAAPSAAWIVWTWNAERLSRWTL